MSLFPRPQVFLGFSPSHDQKTKGRASSVTPFILYQQFLDEEFTLAKTAQNSMFWTMVYFCPRPVFIATEILSDLPALPTQNNLSGSPCEDKQSKKKNRGLFRAKRIIKRMSKLLKLKNGN
jgi:hypothetical protein